MQKYLTIFAGACLIVAAILAAVYYQQRNAVNEGYDIKCVQPSEPTSATNSLACVIRPSQNADQGKPKPPWWNVLLAWPEGITAWLLMLTLAAIVWQAWETRKTAENAGKQLAFQQETLRPRLKITEFMNNVFDEAMAGEWVIANMKISNSGGLPAYGVIADTWIEFIRGVPPYRFSSQSKYARAEHTLNIHSGAPSGFFIPLQRKLTEEERRNMGGAMGAICFRVKLTYRAFGEEVHTDDAYLVRPDGMEAIGEYSSET